MKKLLFAAIIVVAIIIAVLFIVKPVILSDLDFNFGLNKSRESTQSVQDTNRVTEKAPEFLDLNTKGRVCTQEAMLGDNKQLTQLSVRQGRLRADITTSNDKTNVKTNAHLVNKDGFVYVWEDSNPVGIRFSEGDYNNKDNYNPLSAIDYTSLKLAAAVDTNCIEKELTDETFSLPKWIEFKEFKVDLSEIQERLAEYCKQCEEAPNAETQASCKQALGCKQ